MTVYLIAKIQIEDREKYAVYEQGFMNIFNEYKGTLLSVDESPECLEGSWSYTRTVLLEFPTSEDARAWYDSKDYQALAQHRQEASVGDLVMITGLEQN